MFYIGIDLGTTSVKLLLVDDHGKVEKTISKDYPISFPRIRRTGGNRRSKV